MRRGVLRFLSSAAVLSSLLWGHVASAQVAVGASFGYSHLAYPDSPRFKNDVVGLPGTQAWGQPGFRIGYRLPGGRWEVLADAGLETVRRSGTMSADETTLEAMPQVQANIAEWRGWSPFVNAGVGVLHETAFITYGASYVVTRPVFGAGAGARRSVSDGHGSVRIELRYDRVPKRTTSLKSYSSADDFVFPTTDMLSVKLGFDLFVAGGDRRRERAGSDSGTAR